MPLNQKQTRLFLLFWRICISCYRTFYTVEAMTPLVAELLEGIRAGTDEAFLGAGEVAAAMYFGLNQYQAVEPYGSRMREEAPTANDVEALKQAIQTYIESSSSPSASAAWALGKFYDPSLVPTLRAQLAIHLEAMLQYNAAISNLMCALENSGEKLISDGSHSLTETEKMIEDSRQYLKQAGLEFPW